MPGTPPEGSSAIAAGGVLWRPAAGSEVPGSCGAGDTAPEVAVVHRPRYDDWSLPKGKPDGAEPLPVTAVREIAEETGHRAVLGPRLCSTRYPLTDGRHKTVHYWAARSIGGAFVAGDEVDELRWLPVPEAGRLLSYAHDLALLDRLGDVVVVTTTVLLVRHGKAGKSTDWSGADVLRPLTGAGRRQAQALRVLLPPFGPAEVHAAAPLRCVQTVQPLVDDLDGSVHPEPLLGEDGYWEDPAAGLRRLLEIAAGATRSAVVCSQGGVIPDVVAALADEAGLDLGPVRSRKGSTWVLSFRPTDGGPRLAAADYHHDPLGRPAD